MAVLDKSKQLKKELGLFNIYTIATGATIASGFFLLPGLAFAQAGPSMILSYLIAAIPVIPALFSTAELSTAMPRAGGVYFFLDRSMGPLMGTIGGLGTWFALILKTSFALVGIGAYLSLFFPNMSMVPLAITFALLFGLLNLFGAKKAGAFQSFLVIGLLVLLAMFSAIGVFHFRPQNIVGLFDASTQSILSTAGLVYVSYVGLSKIASVSEEVKNPDKNIPLAMFLALGTAIIVYTIGTLVIIGVVPPEILAGNLTPVATTAEFMIGHYGAILMTIAAILAFFSVANAGILSCSRYPLAMSRDHLMPRFLRKLSKKQTPKYAILVTVGFVMIILLLFDPNKIAKLAGAFQLMLFALISVAVIVMRESRLDSYDPGFRSPFYPWMQIFGIITPGFLIIEMGWLPSVVTVVFVMAGILWYVYYARTRVIRDGAIYHIFARLGERRYEGIDTELRSIIKEKGLRNQDPFDTVVANARFIDIEESPSFEAIVAQVSQYFATQTGANAQDLQSEFMEGTQIGATPVSHGAALPHIRLKGIEHSMMVMVRIHHGMRVEAVNPELKETQADNPIFAIFFLISPEDNPGQHLRILAQIATHADDEKFMPLWRSGENEQELKELLLRDDRYLSLLLSSRSKTATLIGRCVRDLDLPEDSLIALIKREGDLLVPHGDTLLQAGDRLTIIGYPKDIQDLARKYLGADQETF